MKTKICLPITESTENAVLDEAKAVREAIPDLVELRADFLDYVEDTAKVVDTLKELKKIVGETGVIFTYRSKSQGGNGGLEPEKVAAILTVAAASSYVTYVDVELKFFEDSASLIKSIKSKGVKVIASHHDFNETPKKKDMYGILKEMRDKGADVCKLAVMPNSEVDVLKLMKVSAEFKEEYPDQRIITMSMGKLGVVSRLGCILSGSDVTFASRQKASAPGQIDIKKLKDILEVVEG